ncbi:MAG: hypothetical protein ACI9O4_001771 [Chitinophagales bacterium]|jgi:hypothetical protein
MNIETFFYVPTLNEQSLEDFASLSLSRSQRLGKTSFGNNLPFNFVKILIE